MDYEKAYKDALERARKFYNDCVKGDNPIQAQRYVDIFSELKESEDERIREMLIEKMEIWHEQALENNVIKDIKDSADIITYLEKQKEQKPAECIEFDNEFENQVSHLLASILNGEHEYNEGFVKYAAQSLLGYAKSEMKPDEWDKREKLFTKALQTANTQIGQLFEENKKLKEQKPAEWSEEDSRMLSDIAGYISGVGSSSGITKRERVDFLYELPKRFNLQPKQEWNEEDEEMHVNVASSLRVYACGLENEEHEKHIKKEINWFENRFKFLRPQSHWKPSEEQMKALYSALNDAISLYSNEISPSYEEISRMHFDVLESLYNDLKKL